MVRVGFRMVLDAQPDMEVVGEAADGVQAVAMATELEPDVVLMDIRMPRMDGLEATRQIIAGSSEARVLVLTTFDLDEYVHSALRAGASGFLLKDAGPAELLAGIRSVASGDAVVAPSATRRLLERFLPTDGGGPSPTDPDLIEALSDREREVLTCVGAGLSNAEIAAKLFLAETTVKTHIGHILAKLGLRDRVQMVITAYDAGLVRPGR
ncbi:MAG: response regulator transcription factor [Acidipropionibacterium jensenii]|nr:response regulator transcription factor [Acidipropionibacterium jensenii]MDN6426974.1 response regulator transcription factor [Acidipropionibacterium jensenii]MDN6441470.1 response regulator transcription factor [Acidipropionibacterium jensenii]MDN6480161.1 response regulator transcription factor [Acidipropionibacterium jensenii]MDN6513245.1 response regulator transcription factor [Acidipropionibacterium jensenii]